MSKDKGIGRLLATLLGCALILCVSFGLVACGGNNDEELIRADITKGLDEFKSPTKESLKKAFAEHDVDMTEIESTYEQIGVDFYEMCEHLFKNFDYTIDGISVEGDKGTVDLTVTSIDLAKVVEQTTNELMEEVQNDPDAYAKLLGDDGSYTALYEMIFDRLYEHLDNDAETTTTSGTVTYSKSDGTWEADDDSMSKLVMGMFGDLDL